jgi:hypothetical protein
LCPGRFLTGWRQWGRGGPGLGETTGGRLELSDEGLFGPLRGNTMAPSSHRRRRWRVQPLLAAQALAYTSRISTVKGVTPGIGGSG